MIKKISEYKFIQQLKGLDFVDEIWLFGSRARGDHQERSDIDLAIVCPNASDADWLWVARIIEEADTLLKIDCIRLDKDSISKALYHHILRDKQVIYVKKQDKA